MRKTEISKLVNEGVGDIKITSAGKVENQRSGNTKILNNNTAASGIVVAGSVINNTGNIEVSNAVITESLSQEAQKITEQETRPSAIIMTMIPN
jgi:uncharacterized protein YciI